VNVRNLHSHCDSCLISSLCVNAEATVTVEALWCLDLEDLASPASQAFLKAWLMWGSMNMKTFCLIPCSVIVKKDGEEFDSSPHRPEDEPT
jgi:hypothetical protein